jgi:hypothetical protein
LEYRLADGGLLEPQRDGLLRIAHSGVVLTEARREVMRV